MSRIEQIIDEIEEFVEGCKRQTFSQSNIIVPKDELMELITELRLKTPEEVKQYKKVLANRDRIIADAQEKAESMIAETTEYANSLIEEHGIMQKAYARAQEVINTTNERSEETILAANEESEQIKRSALEYADNLVSTIKDMLDHTYEAFRTDSDSLLKDLSFNIGVLKDNSESIKEQLSTEEEDEFNVPKMDSLGSSSDEEELPVIDEDLPEDDSEDLDLDLDELDEDEESSDEDEDGDTENDIEVEEDEEEEDDDSREELDSDDEEALDEDKTVVLDDFDYEDID